MYIHVRARTSDALQDLNPVVAQALPVLLDPLPPPPPLARPAGGRGPLGLVRLVSPRLLDRCGCVRKFVNPPPPLHHVFGRLCARRILGPLRLGGRLGETHVHVRACTKMLNTFQVRCIPRDSIKRSSG